ncbi:MAG TPA: hypothetical protein VGU67_02835 [Edaphobacter sp.]|nr:hypothetical protein [Edaphobacter sp.]
MTAKEKKAFELIESHKLDCQCELCMEFVNSDNAEEWKTKIASQNAAESLPAQPEHLDETEHIHALIREADEEAKTTSANGANWRGFVESLREPVAPVEAKEKALCPDCNHKSHYALRCGALIATGSDGEFVEEVRCECLNWVAEPKPTPSTEREECARAM